MKRIWHRGGGTSGATAVALLTGVSMLAGCRILSIDEDRAIRARRGGGLDPTAYVAGLWAARALPALGAAATPLETLAPAMEANLDRAGVAHGRRAGEGSPWTFVVRGSGRVLAVDAGSRRGRVTVAMPGRTAEIQIGPVVAGSAVRDALPFVTFDDFADQLAFADVGRALTARALAGVRPAVARLRPGQVIGFVGVANVRDPGAPLVLTPISLTVDRAG